MTSNFDFLSESDNNLYGIIADAERLYRGEFFEQCMGQTRRFGEHICRKVLGNNRTTEVTFDEMLATLKDKSKGSEQEKEFIDDLYFLKKCGNNSVHSDKVQQDGTTALECLQRAFEISINYAVYHLKQSSDLLKLRYDTELLVTGKPSVRSLTDKYIEAKEKAVSKVSAKKNKSTKSKQVTSMNSVPKPKKFSIFWVIVVVSIIFALSTIVYLIL